MWEHERNRVRSVIGWSFLRCSQTLWVWQVVRVTIIGRFFGDLPS
jgi:hypothetical protein